MNESAKIYATRRRIARMQASSLRQLAKFINKVAKDASDPIYMDRVMGLDFRDAVNEAYKAAWKVSDIVVPRDPKTGYADARKLMQAVLAHAFRPDVLEESEPHKTKVAPAKPEGDALLRTGEPRR